MGKATKRALVVLALVAGPVLYSVFASTEVAITAGYPVGTTFYMEEAGTSFAAPPVFLGAYLVTPLVLGRLMPSPLLVDAGFLYWSAGHLLVAHVDLGLGLDLWIIHTSIAAGLSLVQYCEPYYDNFRNYENFRTWGSDMVVRIGLKLGQVSVGMGLSAPLGAVLRFVTQDWPVVRDLQDELMLFSGQLTASVGYCF